MSKISFSKITLEDKSIIDDKEILWHLSCVATAISKRMDTDTFTISIFPTTTNK